MNKLKLDDLVRAAMGYDALDESLEVITNAAIITRNALEEALAVYVEAHTAYESARVDFEEALAAYDVGYDSVIIARKALNSARETYAEAYAAAFGEVKVTDAPTVAVIPE